MKRERLDSSKLAKAIRLFNELPASAQRLFVHQIPRRFVLGHPALEAAKKLTMDFYWRLRRSPRKLGKPDRNAIIDKLRREERLSYGMIGNDPRFVAANGGKRARAETVEQAHRRWKRLHSES